MQIRDNLTSSDSILFGAKKPIPNKTIHQLFEEQVEKTPTNIAITYMGKELTYRDLNNKANQMTRYLRKLGVKTESLVGICVDRSLEMIIAILAILKAGGAYVPIDPDYPPKRRQYLLKDSGVNILLTQKKLTDQCVTLGKRIDKVKKIIILDENKLNLEKENKKNVKNLISPNCLAYVIYTSGSTGEPKGVMIEHYSAVNTIISQIDRFQINSNARILAFASISFDASVSEIFTSLLSGATLVILPKEKIISGNLIIEALKENKITTVTFPPSMLRILLFTNLPSLKTLISAGEACSSKMVKIRANSQHLFINAYGPTEATICATIAHLSAKDIPHIGKPIANINCYILDENFNPVQKGTIGELYIGGIGLARGYLNKPKLTKKKFIQCHFSGQDSNVRLYKTGDLVRQLSDGNLEFIGRIDNQVKIRGFRVELEEIEKQLLKHELVQQAVAVDKQDCSGNKYIFACVVLKDKNKFNPKELKLFLKEILPDYMIPSAFVLSDHLPLTSNGKIDREFLKNNNNQSIVKKNSFKVTSSSNEKLLVTIWADALNIPQSTIGTNDNFFEIGGHSLLATLIVIYVRIYFSVNLNIADIFRYPTIELLAQKIENTPRYSKRSNSTSIPNSKKKSRIPLSYSQEQIWLHQSLAPALPLFNEPSCLHIHDKIDIPILEKSINYLLKRHEILRLMIDIIRDVPLQSIRAFSDYKLSFIDLRHLSIEEKQKRTDILASKQAKTPFNFKTELLIRFLLIQQDKAQFDLFITAHHLIIDGVTMFQLFSYELKIIYYALSQKKTISLPNIATRYIDFAIWQKKQKFSSGDREYWERKLEDLSPLHLPTTQNDLSSPSQPSSDNFQGERQCFIIPKSLTASLKSFSQQKTTTLFITLLSSFYVLLYRYTNQEDIAVGTVIAGRDFSGIQKTAGNFLNTLILRSSILGNLTFNHLLDHIKKMVIEAYQHQSLPFQETLKLIKSRQKNARWIPFEVSFVFEPSFSSNLKTDPTWRMSQVEIHTETTKFDLTFELDDRGDHIIGRAEYNKNLFQKDAIHSMINHFRILLLAITKITETTYCSIDNLPLLTKKEQQLLLIDRNNNKFDYPKDKTIHQIFEEQVEKTPDKLAIVSEGKQLTYSELNQKANQLAHYLKRHGVKAETLVAICMERGLNMIIGILAILKAGGAYVPISPNNPQVRIQYILEDIESPILLTQSKLEEKLLFYRGKKISLDTFDFSNNKISDNLPLTSSANNLIYVIYTSGSTGKPKGVMIEHRSVCNILHSVSSKIGLTNHDCLASITTFTFDISVLEFFVTFLVGAKLLLFSDKIIRNTSLLIDTLDKSDATYMQATPSLWQLLIDTGWQNQNQIKCLCGGEQLPRSLAKRLTARSQYVWNLYGPTETTIWSTMSQVDNNPTIINIGSALANTQLYVLNEALQPAPEGIVGELYIGGDGLFRGYWNLPEITKEKTIKNPFSSNKTSLIYKTGDLVRWLRNGNLEYVGRIDDQVKIRGFRIECGEIETTILKYPDVLQSVIVAKEGKDGVKSLLAYLVAKKKIEASKLRKFLQQYLPDYMIPSYFIFLNELPLTSNGKINKKILPSPNLSKPQKEKDIFPPRTLVEKKLLKIWTKVLKIEKLSIHGNFFELGGHSLAALNILSQIEKVFGVALDLNIFFKAPSIAEVAKLISQKNKYEYQASENIILFKQNKIPTPIVAMRKSDSKSPLFLIHPMGGAVFCFMPLLQYLDKRYSVYGLQDPGLHTRKTYFTNLEDMASFYKKAIQTIQSHGPYLLGGASYGATLAVEIAKQFETENEPVEFLGLLDGWAFYPEELQNRDFFEDNLRLLHQNWKKYFIENGIFKIESLFELQWQREKLLSNYKLSKINHQLILFKAKEKLAYFEAIQSPCNHWDQYTTNPIIVHTVPGSHDTIYEEPNVKFLAQEMNKYLKV